MQDLVENIDYVVCRVCQLQMLRISSSHLRKHSLTLSQYLQQFPEVVYASFNSVQKRSASLKARDTKWIEQANLKRAAQREITSQKVSESLRKFYSSVEGKVRIREMENKRKVTRPEVNQRRSITLKKHWSTEEGKATLAARSVEGNAWKPEASAKRKASLLAFRQSEEGKACLKRNADKRRGVPRTAETKLKISLKKRGHSVNAYTRQQVSIAQKNRVRSPQEVHNRHAFTRRKISTSNKNFWNSAEGKQRSAEIVGKREQNGWKEKRDVGYSQFLNSPRKQQQLQRIRHTNGSIKHRVNVSVGVLKSRENPEYWEHQQKSLKTSPNRFEQVVATLLPSSFLFTGNFNKQGNFKYKTGKVKNADFISHDRQKVVECFGEYWHGKEVQAIGKEEHEQATIQNYKDIGVECLIIWENELKHKDILQLKIHKFLQPNFYKEVL